MAIWFDCVISYNEHTYMHSFGFDLGRYRFGQSAESALSQCLVVGMLLEENPFCEHPS